MDEMKALALALALLVASVLCDGIGIDDGFHHQLSNKIGRYLTFNPSFGVGRDSAAPRACCCKRDDDVGPFR